MIPVALLLWRVVLKPLIDWWNGVAPTGKALEASETKKTDPNKAEAEEKSVSAPENQSQLRYVDLGLL